MSDRVTYTLNDGVATIKMDDGKANALSSAMIADINAAFDKAEADSAVVILTGRERIMSGGFDLKEIGNGPQAALDLVNKGSLLARRIMAFPRPVVMVAPGHTIAMGAFLALACDYAIIAEGDFKVGLNETLIGMTMHNFGIELARNRLANNYFNRAVFNAEIYSPRDSVRAGFFDRTVPLEQLPMAGPMAGNMFKQHNETAFMQTKLRSQRDTFKILDQAIEDDLDPAKVYAL